ncbi:MAG: hypothetical protein ABH808_01950 [Candidatus Kuenenbacteria bacterium]
MDKQKLQILGLKNSTITSYEGKEGVKTITRNSLNAKDNLYICEMSLASLNEIFSEQEAENIRKEFLAKNTKIKEITNQVYHEYTDIKEFDEKCMEIRYLSSDKFDIKTEYLIYNDIVAFYSYKDEFFAVEIKNAKFAQTQLNIFKLLWNQAERPIIGRGGRSSIF